MLVRLNAILERINHQTRRRATATGFKEKYYVAHEFVGLRIVEFGG